MVSGMLFHTRAAEYRPVHWNGTTMIAVTRERFCRYFGANAAPGCGRCSYSACVISSDVAVHGRHQTACDAAYCEHSAWDKRAHAQEPNGRSVGSSSLLPVDLFS